VRRAIVSGAIVAAIALGIAQGCGGAAQDAASPSNPTSAPTRRINTVNGQPDEEKGLEPSYRPTPPPGYPSSTAPGPQPTSQYAQPPKSEDQLLLQTLDATERELETAASDCASACRALASMERATAQLCAIADATRCDSAKQRLLAARDRVRQTCNVCPGGPSVERDAPIPPAPQQP
jgi:hypothetical protein